MTTPDPIPPATQHPQTNETQAGCPILRAAKGGNDDSPSVQIAWRIYKSLLSPVLHAFSFSQCVFLPTCSEYAYVALHRFGVLRGSYLTLRRLLRCHPFSKGGLDPVPTVAGRRQATDHPDQNR